MPGRLLGFRRSSPNSSQVDLSAKRRDSFHAHRVHARGISPDPLRHQKRRSSNIEVLIGKKKEHSRSRESSVTAMKSDKSVYQLELHKPAQLGLVVESPPLVLFNSPDSSTGALFSGQLIVDVKQESVTFKSFIARFTCTTTYKRPVADRCPECTTQTDELKKWDFLAEPIRVQSPLTLHRGEHKFPFTYLLPGHLPATTHGINAVLDYHITATATTTDGDTLPFAQPITVKRAIPPGPDKHSVRIVPPTNLTTQVTLPPTIHPIGEFPIAMRMSGISTRKNDCILRWKLRRLIWRIEETQKVLLPVCPAHAHKLTTGEPHHVEQIETRDVGAGELKSGWKTDTDADVIEIEFRALVDAAAKPVCNMHSANGLSVKHNLVVEMVVAEDWSAKKKPNSATPTGAARVLRTQFGLVLTERAGMGIAWDDEQPPTYDDVPDSPPTYVVATVVEGMEQMGIEDAPAYEE